MREKGYANIRVLMRMSPAERAQMVKHVSMKPGRAQTLSMHLDGRLPTAPSSAAAVCKMDEDGRDSIALGWALPVQLWQDEALAPHNTSSAFRQCSGSNGKFAKPGMTDKLRVVQA